MPQVEDVLAPRGLLPQSTEYTRGGTRLKDCDSLAVDLCSPQRRPQSQPWIRQRRAIGHPARLVRAQRDQPVARTRRRLRRARRDLGQCVRRAGEASTYRRWGGECLVWALADLLLEVLPPFFVTHFSVPGTIWPH
jgi:hypothetical protein